MSLESLESPSLTSDPSSADLQSLLKTPESETFERKISLDLTKTEDVLGLVADVVAMANTRGGAILIGEHDRTVSPDCLPLFDSARLDDKVNSFAEPRVCGILSSTLGDHFVLVRIAKSENPPHVFKKDGNVQEAPNKQRPKFRLGDILVRHSSKTERANRSDMDRWYEERRERLFENIKMVFDAGPSAYVHISDREGPPVRIDPDAPGAQPVYDLLTADPFRDLEQELVGGVKAWKTSRQILNEAQIVKAYRDRDRITNSEIVELILRSCWENRLPGYYWAGKTDPARLFVMMEDAVREARYVVEAEALKLASLVPNARAKELLNNANRSTRISTRSLCKKLESVLRAKVARHLVLARILHSGKSIRFTDANGIREINIDEIDAHTFEELLQTVPAWIKENRSPFRVVELLIFGAILTQSHSGQQESGDTVERLPTR